MSNQEKIKQYIKILREYNQNINIYSQQSYDKLDFHIQDSLNLAKIIGNRTKKVIDMGSGSGFPSVILAIENPKNQIIAIESKLKKCHFLNLVQQKLNLKNFQVKNADVNEILLNFQAEFYTAKAFKKIPNVIKIYKKLGKNQSTLIIPISQNQLEGLSNDLLDKNFIKIISGQYFYLLVKK